MVYNIDLEPPKVQKLLDHYRQMTVAQLEQIQQWMIDGADGTESSGGNLDWNG